MRNKNWSGWIAWLALGVIEAILVSQMPRVLTHTSNEDLHRFLFLNRSATYWLFCWRIWAVRFWQGFSGCFF